MRLTTSPKVLALTTALLALTLAVGCGKNPYETPIGTNSQQPDKILFDKAVNDLERHRYELSRLTLQTLINTYPDSEYLAKAKLAIADSWYREGGSSALAQAEAEYKDFITFFPTMEEAAESQLKICEIHFEQMEKPDRDPTHAKKADIECRQVLLSHPNTVFAEQTKQRLREAQEVIAGGEFRVGEFYSKRGSFRAASNRLQAVTDHYPLFSQADEALWVLGGTYETMGEQFVEQSASAYSKIVRDYPLSEYVDLAKEKLANMNRPIPDSDPDRYEVMKYNLDNRGKKGNVKKVLTMFGSAPNVRAAAKRGDPAMTTLLPSIPVGVRPLTGVGGGDVAGTGTAAQPSAEVGVETISGPSALDTEPDARLNQQNNEEEQPNEGGQQP